VEHEAKASPEGSLSDDTDIYQRLAEHEFRGELRLMTLRQFLAGWGVELRTWRTIPVPAPDYRCVVEAQFFTRRWNALQAQAFIHATCNDPEGFPCQATVVGKHEFLRGGLSSAHFRLWI
jgi:hypothetical protein